MHKNIYISLFFLILLTTTTFAVTITNQGTLIKRGHVSNRKISVSLTVSELQTNLFTDGTTITASCNHGDLYFRNGATNVYCNEKGCPGSTKVSNPYTYTLQPTDTQVNFGCRYQEGCPETKGCCCPPPNQMGSWCVACCGGSSCCCSERLSGWVMAGYSYKNLKYVPNTPPTPPTPPTYYDENYVVCTNIFCEIWQWIKSILKNIGLLSQQTQGYHGVSYADGDVTMNYHKGDIVKPCQNYEEATRCTQ